MDADTAFKTIGRHVLLVTADQGSIRPKMPKDLAPTPTPTPNTTANRDKFDPRLKMPKQLTERKTRRLRS